MQNGYMAKPPGRCIFCGGFGLTKEHVLPDWLRAIFPRLPTDTHTLGAIDWVALPTVGLVPLPSHSSAQGQVGSKKVKVVCKSCNNGWMSRLEETAKPLVEELLHGHHQTLREIDQRLLATWITKTAMTAEFIRPTEVAIPKNDRQWLQQHLEPPAHWSIWADAYLGTKWQAGVIFHQGVGLYPPPHPVRIGVKNTQYTVIGIGRFIAQVASSQIPGLTFSRQEKVWKTGCQLWPLPQRDITWPPSQFLNEVGADAVVTNFGRTLGVPAPKI